MVQMVAINEQYHALLLVLDLARICELTGSSRMDILHVKLSLPFEWQRLAMVVKFIHLRVKSKICRSALVS